MPNPGKGATPQATPRIHERYAAIMAPEARKAPNPPARPAAELFRLVSVSGDMAFIEHRNTKRQDKYIAGDVLSEGYVVSEVKVDCVVLATPRGEELLSFDGAAIQSVAQENGGHDVAKSLNSGEAFFRRLGGERTGTNVWSFSREAVLGYVDELKARPERLVAVFDSLAPVYENDGKIGGYSLDVKGEGAFFDAVGLGQGDIVRSVNYIPMTNRKAAESLIRRFCDNDDFDFVVLEIERDGSRLQQVYNVH